MHIAVDKRGAEIPREKVLDIIDEVADWGVKRIKFTGGEPLVRDDIYLLMKHAKKRGLWVQLNTNGLLLKNNLTNLVDCVFLPYHSLDNMQELRELIFRLKNQGMNLTLNTIISKKNILRFEEFYRLIKELKLDWVLSRVVPTKTNPNPINNSDIKLLIEKLLSMKIRPFIDSIPLCAYEPDKLKLFSRGANVCGVVDKIVIGADGKVKPCYSIFGEGDNLKDTWNGLSKKFRSFEMVPNVCKKCIYIYDCMGGCRWAAKLLTGKLDGLDPLAQPDKYYDDLFSNNQKKN